MFIIGFLSGYQAMINHFKSLMNTKSLLVLQLVGTLLILAFLPGNLVKLSLFALLWVITFKGFAKNEIIFYLVVCVFFTVMNVLSLKQGIFAFNYPDILGVPYYELVMWGFYLLHTVRMLGGAVPKGPERSAVILLALYCVAFSVIPDQTVLLIVTGILLSFGLYLFHEPMDWMYVFYMVGLGAAIEYTGVWSGQWHYPGDVFGGVPLWFITLWGGVGFFVRRVAVPLVYRNQDI